MNNFELEAYLDDLLKSKQIKDYCPNGLQIQGKDSIEKIVTGVTASQALIDEAVKLDADAIFVHHGYFWKGEPQKVVGMKYRRFKALIQNDINLLAYHLPLDIHPELGNNAQLAKLLGIELTDGLDAGNPLSVGNIGRLEKPTAIESFSNTVSEVLGRDILVETSGKATVETVALCTGGAQDYIEQAFERGADLYITGEVSERTIHTARELGINFIAAGHHATERYGAKALGEHLAEKFGFEVINIDIDNPA